LVRSTLRAVSVNWIGPLFPAERVLQQAQRATGPGGNAVELVAHVVVDSQMPLDEQQSVEREQRIAKRDLPP